MLISTHMFTDHANKLVEVSIKDVNKYTYVY